MTEKGAALILAQLRQMRAGVAAMKGDISDMMERLDAVDRKLDGVLSTLAMLTRYRRRIDGRVEMPEDGAPSAI